jgi:hypothetical protein
MRDSGAAPEEEPQRILKSSRFDPSAGTFATKASAASGESRGFGGVRDRAKQKLPAASNGVGAGSGGVRRCGEQLHGAGEAGNRCYGKVPESTRTGKQARRGLSSRTRSSAHLAGLALVRAIGRRYC